MGNQEIDLINKRRMCLRAQIWQHSQKSAILGNHRIAILL